MNSALHSLVDQHLQAQDLTPATLSQRVAEKHPQAFQRKLLQFMAGHYTEGMARSLSTHLGIALESLREASLQDHRVQYAAAVEKLRPSFRPYLWLELKHRWKPGGWSFIGLGYMCRIELPDEFLSLSLESQLQLLKQFPSLSVQPPPKLAAEHVESLLFVDDLQHAWRFSLGGELLGECGNPQVLLAARSIAPQHHSRLIIPAELCH
jgi:hypothetical protein